MQGTWKENLSGWNNKGFKRKKHTRKHTLKDKSKVLISRKKFKNQDINSISIEGDIEFLKEPKKYKYSGWVETWIIKVERYIGHKYIFDKMENRNIIMDIYSYSSRVAYEVNNIWYDEYTNEKINDFNTYIKKLDFLFKEEVKYENPIEIKQYNHKLSNWSIKPTIYIYGKPINKNYWKKYRFYSSKRRKIAQKYVISKERTIFRNWKSKAHWKSEIPLHSLQKSINWLVY